MKSVDLVIPCYNEESTIRPLLDSVFAQTYPRAQMELIISDGMSTDRTREVIVEFQKEHVDLAKDLCAFFRTKTNGLDLHLRRLPGFILYIVRPSRIKSAFHHQRCGIFAYSVDRVVHVY